MEKKAAAKKKKAETENVLLTPNENQMQPMVFQGQNNTQKDRKVIIFIFLYMTEYIYVLCVY